MSLLPLSADRPPAPPLHLLHRLKPADEPRLLAALFFGCPSGSGLSAAPSPDLLLGAGWRGAAVSRGHRIGGSPEAAAGSDAGCIPDAPTDRRASASSRSRHTLLMRERRVGSSGVASPCDSWPDRGRRRACDHRIGPSQRTRPASNRSVHASSSPLLLIPSLLQYARLSAHSSCCRCWMSEARKVAVAASWQLAAPRHDCPSAKLPVKVYISDQNQDIILI